MPHCLAYVEEEIRASKCGNKLRFLLFPTSYSASRQYTVPTNTLFTPLLLSPSPSLHWFFPAPTLPPIPSPLLSYCHSPFLLPSPGFHRLPPTSHSYPTPSPFLTFPFLRTLTPFHPLSFLNTNPFFPFTLLPLPSPQVSPRTGLFASSTNSSSSEG